MSDLDLWEIRRLHGGTVYDGGRRWVGPGPGHSRRDQSLSVLINDQGRPVVHSFAGDDFGACAAHLGLERSGVQPMARADRDRLRRERQQSMARKVAEDRAFCQAIWAAAQPIEGTPAEAYLWRRGLIYEGAELRFHAAAPRSRSKPHTFPGMVALVRNGRGVAGAFHVTFLTPDGQKAFAGRSRLMFGGVAGGAVRLSPMRPDGVLAIGEGLETSAAYAVLHGIPTWAALSTSGLQSFEIPFNVRRLIIAADADDNGAGLAAAAALAGRACRVCDVEVRPAPAGQDWADVLEAQR